MIEKWQNSPAKEVLTGHIFKYVTVESNNPDGTKSGTFDIIHCFDWVNIVAINQNNEIIMVKQYRHGNDSITLIISDPTTLVFLMSK